MRITNGQFEATSEISDLIIKSGYSSLAHAVCELSVFPPPSLVSEVGFKPIVNAVRRGKFGHGIGRRERDTLIAPHEAHILWRLTGAPGISVGVMVDDNLCANLALMSCYDLGRNIPSTTLAHVFPSEYSKHPLFFTALPNLLLAPAWLAKLTDAKAGAVARTLRWTIREVYGFCAACTPQPSQTLGNRCWVCAGPPDRGVDAASVRLCAARFEYARTQDYERRARSIHRRGRWQQAIAAGAGYSHPLLTP